MKDVAAKPSLSGLHGAEQGMAYAISIFSDRNTSEVSFLIKAPSHLLRSWRNAANAELPLNLRWELNEHPDHPVIRLVVCLSEEKHPFRGEIVFDTGDPVTLKALNLLKNQERVVVQFCSSEGDTIFHRIYPWRALMRRETRKIANSVAQRDDGCVAGAAPGRAAGPRVGEPAKRQILH